MSRTAQTVSIRNLHAAVHKALDAAKAKHQDLISAKTITFSPAPGIIYRPGLLCGWISPDPYTGGLDAAVHFNNTFVSELSASPAVAALAVNGKFEPTVNITGSQVSLGFVPAEAPISE